MKKRIIQVIIVILFIICLLFIASTPKGETSNEDLNSYEYNFENQIFKAHLNEDIIKYGIYDKTLLLFTSKDNTNTSYISVLAKTNPSSTEECQEMLNAYRNSLSDKYKTTILTEENSNNKATLNYTLFDSNGNIVTVYSKAETNTQNTIMVTFFLAYSKDNKINNEFKILYDTISLKD